MSEASSSLSLASIPLCVDMDETLVHKDVLFLGIGKLLMKKPWLIPWFIVWLCINRAAAKAWLAKEIELDAASLPYRTELLDYIKEQKAHGRKIYLVSAADQRIVKSVGAYLGCFDAVYGSDGKTNLKGSAKAEFIRNTIGRRFVYAGDSFVDLLVWQHASAAILCGKARMFKSRLSIPIEASFV